MTMKKNVIIIAGIAWLTILATSITFASANTGNAMQWTTGQKTNGFMHNRWGHGNKWMMFGFGPGMDSWAKMWIGSGMGLILNQEKQGIQTAIKNNDYSAYLTAYENAKLTQDQFTKIVKTSQSKTAIETAIKNNDYTAYLAAVKGTSLEGKVTQAQFTDMVAKNIQRTALRDAILNNDYTAYTNAVKGTPMEGKVTQAQFATMVQHSQQSNKKGG